MRLGWRGTACEAVHPAIRPGEVLASLDFRRSPFPGRDARDYAATQWTLAGTASGVEFRALEANIGMSFYVPRLRVRHVCLRLAARAVDPGMSFGLILRDEPLGEASTRYLLLVHPTAGELWLQRTWVGGGVMGSSDIVPAIKTPAIRGVGSFNEIELRAQEATLEAWVNGVRVVTAHDPSFGIGRVGLEVTTARGGIEASRRVEVVGFEARGVAP